MASVVVELSDDVMERLLKRASDNVEGFVSEAIIAALDEDDYIEGSGELSPEDMESIGRGLAELDAGQGRDGDEVFAELFARVGLPFRG